ncbi:MAG: SMP-30/gluconolactonase/LRE family protein [Bacteroidota bacterium]
MTKLPAKLTFICLITVNALYAQQNDVLFTASVFTPVKGFTSGVEGPGVDRNGILYAVNFAKEGTIGMVTPTGSASLFVELPAGSIGNGIRFNKKGEMFIADYTMHNILKVNMKTKAITVHANEPSMAQPNDIAIDNKGRLYASDPDWKARTGKIWTIDKKGKVTLLESGMSTTNGIEVSPDNKTLYVTHARQVLAYDLSNGRISNKRILFEFPDFGMDGMRSDSEGNLYISRPGKGTVVKLSPSGKILREVTLTGKKPSNVAFGGQDGRTVYVTMQDQGNIESFRTDLPGREWLMNKR